MQGAVKHNIIQTTCKMYFINANNITFPNYLEKLIVLRFDIHHKLIFLMSEHILLNQFWGRILREME